MEEYKSFSVFQTLPFLVFKENVSRTLFFISTPTSPEKLLLRCESEAGGDWSVRTPEDGAKTWSKKDENGDEISGYSCDRRKKAY